jgi:hypothetical protein
LDDPANEKGIDLDCIHKKNHKKIVIAVKKKPKLNDLGQVIQLSQQGADQRIYLYLNGATQSFRDQMGMFKSTIEFWDEKLLEKNLDESHLAIWLKIVNSINKIIFTTVEYDPQKSFPKPTRVLYDNYLGSER